MEYYNAQHQTVDPEAIAKELEEQPNTLVATQLAAKKKVIEAATKKKLKKKFQLFSGHVSVTDKMVFLDNLSTMLKAGLPLSAGLSTLAAEMKNKYFRSVLERIRALVENGELFSDGLKTYPDVFPDILVATIEVGESSGLLSDVLGHLAALLKAEKELKSKVFGALMYPIVVLTALVGVSIVLALFVFPKLIEIFVESGVKLPIIFIAMQAIVSVLTSYGWYLLGGLLVLAILTNIIFRQYGPRLWLHGIMLRLPIAGSLIREIGLTRFTGNLKILLSSGLPIVKSLETVSKTAGNLQFQKAIMAMSSELGKGLALHDALASRPLLFPSLMIQLCKVGEETGELENILEKVSQFYETRVNNVLANLSVILEPVLLILVGIAVGFIAVSVIGPIYDLTNSFGNE